MNKVYCCCYRQADFSHVSTWSVLLCALVKQIQIVVKSRVFSKQGHLLRRLKVRFQEKKIPGLTAEQQKVRVVGGGGGTWGQGGRGDK